MESSDDFDEEQSEFGQSYMNPNSLSRGSRGGAM